MKILTIFIFSVLIVFSVIMLIAFIAGIVFVQNPMWNIISFYVLLSLPSLFLFLPKVKKQFN